jgi:hypothetical protein
MSHWAKSTLARAKRATAIVFTTGCLLAGAGSVAKADEFMLLRSGGIQVPNAEITVLNPAGHPIQVINTDHLGRFFFPYSGAPANYQFQVYLGGQRRTGTFFVTGARGTQPVTINY